ncbi:hypothetical protein EJ06DRAFT_531413 [Trichodelitschia bisporula]|uniref:GRIP domain-containing protein n=1 Tax=Trichodelitschia bisporula TaxID=703511 RepID=A0A6G1HT62_9PEZI|nr:hypothetical protein EJ06DRAFT_531413 [Trichodelitschia bisporula]
MSEPSSAAAMDSAPPGKSSKKASKKSRKKKNPAKDTNGSGHASNGSVPVPDADHDSEAEEKEPEPLHETEDEPIDSEPVDKPAAPPSPVRNGLPTRPKPDPSDGDPDPADSEPDPDADPSTRLDALTRQRASLRAEVAQLRATLEANLTKHAEEIAALKQEVEAERAEKEAINGKYDELVERVGVIRASLGERLKQDSQAIEEYKGEIEELQEQGEELQKENSVLKGKVAKLNGENEAKARDIDGLRARAVLAQQNWVKERDELIAREAGAREEFEVAKQAMQDWEVIAMEERAQRENLAERVADMEDRLASQREAYDRAAEERDAQAQTVDGLQHALRDIQDARKKELRELVENSQSQLSAFQAQFQSAELAQRAAETALADSRAELERLAPFEKEVKEKNLLIGKLRHEAVILNDHLTKALRFLKQRKPEDMVDRQIVTNHFLHFLALDRSDPLKFQVLQLIAALLAWDDEQKEQAGLARPGAASTASALRVPLTPFRRTPSSPSLQSAELALENRASKESLAELWSSFLEREAQEGAARRPSGAMSQR